MICIGVCGQSIKPLRRGVGSLIISTMRQTDSITFVHKRQNLRASSDKFDAYMVIGFNFYRLLADRCDAKQVIL